MKKDYSNILKKYLTILESENISDTFSTQASTKYTVDNTQKFLPIAHDQAEEEKRKPKSHQLREKLKSAFSKLSTLIKVCESDRCSVKHISELIHLMENPEFKNDLHEYKTELQKDNVESGFNSGLAS